MKRSPALLLMVLLALAMAAPSGAQTQEVKVMGETIAVQAEGAFEADPDLATLTFVVSTQEKDLKKAYDSANQSLKRIADLASRNGLQKEDVTTGVLTVVPIYDYSDHKRKARAYSVDGEVVLRLKDFLKIGPLVDEVIQDGITDFRSLAYSLFDEEAAKQKAIAQAMQRAASRAGIALEQNRQKLGALRFVNLDIHPAIQGQPTVNLPTRSEVLKSPQIYSLNELTGPLSAGSPRIPSTPLPSPHPDKIGVTATVQCVFQIQ